MKGVVATTQHLPHLLMLGVPLLVFAAIFVAQWQVDLERPPLSRLVVLMALSVVGSTAVHGFVIRSHFGEGFLVGTFFLVLTIAQVGYVVALLLRPVRSVVVAGVLGHLSVVALWAWTRAINVPFGLGGRERIGVLDLTATGLEVACVLCGLAVVYRATGGPPPVTVKWSNGTMTKSPSPLNVSTP